MLTVRKWRESIILTEAEAENGAMLFIYLNTYNASFYNIHQIRPKQFQHSNQNIIPFHGNLTFMKFSLCLKLKFSNPYIFAI